MSQSDLLFRVVFSHNGATCELFAKYICEDSLMGFVEVEDLVFSDSSKVVVDTNEERLQQEFKGVKRTYIPLHSVMRIDEVAYKDCGKVHVDIGSADNISYLGSADSVGKQQDNESGSDL